MGSRDAVVTLALLAAACAGGDEVDGSGVSGISTTTAFDLATELADEVVVDCAEVVDGFVVPEQLAGCTTGSGADLVMHWMGTLDCVDGRRAVRSTGNDPWTGWGHWGGAWVSGGDTGWTACAWGEIDPTTSTTTTSTTSTTTTSTTSTTTTSTTTAPPSTTTTEEASPWPVFPESLLGVEWQVTAVEFEGESVPRPEGAKAHIVFESDGLLSGHLGCNGLGVGFVGTFEEPESIGVGSTDMGCVVKDWYEVAYVLQGVYEGGISSLRHREVTGTAWLRTAYGVLELHDPAVVPSQTPEEAARDGVRPELAAHPYEVRVLSLLEVEAEEGTWVLAELRQGAGLPERIGDEEGEWPRDWVSRDSYGEVLLTDGAGRILKAWPMPDLVPRWILLTDDRVYAGREEGACGLASAILRIDRATLETDSVAFARSGELSHLLLPGWYAAGAEAQAAHLPIFWQPTAHDGEGVEAVAHIARYIVDVEAADRFIDAVIADTDPVPDQDGSC